MNNEQQHLLLKLARQSIVYGLKEKQPMPTPEASLGQELLQQRASFVTLEKDHQLRGCIGSLQAHQDLATDVIHNAFKAAFADPRFAPVQFAELPDIHISISVLTLPEPLQFNSEDDLLAQIQPKIDGLILQDGQHRGTFLPSVWENLPDKQQFWIHLKNKAGLSHDHWSDNLKCFKYQTEYFGE